MPSRAAWRRKGSCCALADTVLSQVQFEIGEIVNLPESYAELTENLGFHHFYRHSYSFYIDWDGLSKLVRPLPETWRRVKAELEEFMRGLQT